MEAPSKCKICSVTANVLISSKLLPFFYISNFLATYTKGKKGGILIFFTAKWTWIDEDKPKGIGGWFGFIDLNLKGFVIVTNSTMMMVVELIL